MELHRKHRHGLSLGLIALVGGCLLLQIQYVESFSIVAKTDIMHSAPTQRHQQRRSKTPKRDSSLAASTSSDNASLQQSIPYRMASVDLSAKWLELVQNDQVAVTSTIPSSSSDDNTDDGEAIGVRYGVRINPNSSNRISFMEFVEPSSLDRNTIRPQELLIVHPKIASMNATLRQAAADSEEDGSDYQKDSSSSSGLQFRQDGNFVAQLQLVRTLRPPPSPGFGTTTNQKSTSTPPPYNAETDSFVTGPLRLEMRPLVAQLNIPQPNQIQLTTPWDVFHNISPADVRGHFLLVPTLKDATKNWRSQSLVASDCHDLVLLASSIDPVGSLVVCFNSVGAGASQNHIHCHLWPAPPIPLLVNSKHEPELPPLETTAGDTEATTCSNDCQEDHDHSHSHSHMIDEDDDNNADKDVMNGWSCYAASRIESIYDFVDIGSDQQEDSGGDDALVQVSYLNYPCFCVELSSVTSVDKVKSVEALSKAVWCVLSCLDDAPHNVCMNNRVSSRDDTTDDVDVDVKIFVRSRERSPTIVPASKLGASEMMGVFHCQSVDQLEELVNNNTDRQASDKPPMVQALEDVSHEDAEELWITIREKLIAMPI